MYGKIPSLIQLFRTGTTHNIDEREEEKKEIEANVTNNTNPICNVLNSNITSANTQPQRSAAHNMEQQNDEYHRDLVQLNCDLRRQIEILKQCSNDEIKMLKARLQTLEKRVYETPVDHHHMPLDDDYKENEQGFITLNMYKQCTKDNQVPTKLCPNVLDIIKISHIYNTIIQSNKKHNETEIQNMIHTKTHKKCDLLSLIEDYIHLLDVHCNHNNIFELRIVYLQLKDILQDRCDNVKKCKCIANIKETSFEPNVFYILDIIHCFVYHFYSDCGDDNDDHDNGQRLRDCVMDKHEHMIEYDKNNAIQNIISNLTIDTSIIDQRTNILFDSKSPKSSISPLSPAKSRSITQDVKLVMSPVKPPKLSAIEMSEDRVRTLSGQINEEQIKSLIDEYDNEEKIAIENEENEDLEDEDSSSALNEIERAEIEYFKLKLDPQKNKKGSKHNLMRSPQESDTWDVQTMEQTVQDMKRQLLHLAMTNK